MCDVATALAERGRVTGGKKPLRSLGRGFWRARDSARWALFRRRDANNQRYLGPRLEFAVIDGKITEDEAEQIVLAEDARKRERRRLMDRLSLLSTEPVSGPDRVPGF